MDEASKTGIVPFQLVKILELQAIQIGARFGESNISCIQGFENRKDERITENMFWFTVPVRSIPFIVCWFSSAVSPATVVVVPSLI
jgi:hypothetical protein